MLTREFSGATNRRIGKGLLVLAVCFALLAAWRWFMEARFLEAANVAYGQVVSITSERDSANVVFHDLTGQAHTISPWVKSAFRSYRVGERVVVLVSPHDPREAKFNEPMQIWATTHLFLYLSILAGAIGLLIFKKILVVGPLRRKRLSIGV